MSEEIKSIIEKRNIENLFHFTRIENLKNIFKYGLLPVEKLEKEGIEYYNNDKDRHDGFLDSVSLSISFPYYEMLYKFQSNYNVNYAILSLQPDVLWEKKCIYSKDNAANSNLNRYLHLGRKNGYAFNSPKYLRGMFNRDNENDDLPAKYPSKVGAEVLVFESIETGYFKGIHFEGKAPGIFYKALPEELYNLKIDERSEYHNKRSKYL